MKSSKKRKINLFVKSTYSYFSSFYSQWIAGKLPESKKTEIIPHYLESDIFYKLVELPEQNTIGAIVVQKPTQKALELLATATDWESIKKQLKRETKLCYFSQIMPVDNTDSFNFYAFTR